MIFDLTIDKKNIGVGKLSYDAKTNEAQFWGLDDNFLSSLCRVRLVFVSADVIAIDGYDIRPRHPVYREWFLRQVK